MVMSDNDSHCIVTVIMTSISITLLALPLLTQLKTTLTTEISAIVTTNSITTTTKITENKIKHQLHCYEYYNSILQQRQCIKKKFLVLFN